MGIYFNFYIFYPMFLNDFLDDMIYLFNTDYIITLNDVNV